MDSIIERLIRIAVETASIGAAFCVCSTPLWFATVIGYLSQTFTQVIDVIVFNVRSDTNLHYFFALVSSYVQ